MANGKGEVKEPDYVLLRENRRKNLRGQLIVLKVVGEDRRGSFFGYAKTISRGGMFITSVNPRTIGEEFEISFKLPAGGAEVKCKAAVAWRREYDPQLKLEPGMGIKFLDLGEDLRGKIDEWVRRT